MPEKNRVLVAMSGGVDSSVAALLLQEQGFELVGVTMKVWDYEGSGEVAVETSCCNLDSVHDARALAVKSGFPHYVIDLRETFNDHVIQNFISEYLSGMTPNPCVLCNSFIKWRALLEWADKLGCSHIATGHYAVVGNERGRYFVSKGKDDVKEQSYVLWGLSQENLSRTMLPLGAMSKDKIRQIARDSGFDRIAGKRESYEICFIPDNDYRKFLKFRAPEATAAIGKGEFRLADEQVVGQHEGYPYYTIGQRKGLNIALGEPYYVTATDPANNRVYLGKKEELSKSLLWIRNVNFQKYAEISPGMEVITKIRYKDPGTRSRLYPEGEEIRIEFENAAGAIAPGQSAVCYEGNDIVAGGIIERSE
ncbi:MAG: tRNA 2-thiouridine(34) synthase MnmA [Bacteroidetes bacterium]|nr:tRNA 2-thiouridine(34) synthase MnmA [Bacteroidota bacterium]MBU1719715.1 tRNA 2-thiouridine(34) synthase MnmA [Bacteroidota bacterium]